MDYLENWLFSDLDEEHEEQLYALDKAEVDLIAKFD